MDDRKYLNLEELIVWSDNPRHGLQVNEGECSEEEVINILIDVVGADKMYNLISDIFASRKLMGNVNPVVVFQDEKYYVYDGNRRISALKALKNPAIIENATLQKKVATLVKGENVDFVDRVFVYITDEGEALEIMDKTHSGEQQGAGMISWEPYQRDTSLNQRGKTLQYPYAFNVCKTLSFTMKSFTNISYTDLDRIFGAKQLREFFDLTESNRDYSDKVEYIVGMLIKYKKQIGFNSFSRHFNISSAKEGDSSITKFCEWVEGQEQSKKNFYFKSNSVEIFEDEKYSFGMLQLYIFDKKKSEIVYNIKELNIQYLSPNGIEVNAVDNSEIGEWKVEINYKDAKHTEIISVKSLFPPRIDFDVKKLFGQGNTINLRKLMIRALDGHGNDKTEEVSITSVGAANITQDTFEANNSIGNYQIAYSFTDITGAPYSITKQIRIIDSANPLLAENNTAPLLSFNGTYNLINISEVVNRLVFEINNLEFEENKCVISTALRTLVELSFDELQTRGKITFPPKSSLEERLDIFKEVLLKGELARLCSEYAKELPSFQSEKNCVNQFDPVVLSSLLNLSAHKSIARIDVTKVAESARKFISPLLVYISLMLR